MYSLLTAVAAEVTAQMYCFWSEKFCCYRELWRRRRNLHHQDRSWCKFRDTWTHSSRRASNPTNVWVVTVLIRLPYRYLREGSHTYTNTRTMEIFQSSYSYISLPGQCMVVLHETTPNDEYMTALYHLGNTTVKERYVQHSYMLPRQWFCYIATCNQLTAVINRLKKSFFSNFTTMNTHAHWASRQCL